MGNRYQAVRFRRLLSALFSIGLMLSLGIGQVSQAQSPDPSQLVRQGVERYQAGDYRGAIAPWRSALTQYQQTNDRPHTAIVLENLARTYQQLGQNESALAHWEQVTALYRQLGNGSQVGRALTEQAQVYSQMGQSRKAIALLCNSDRGQTCTSDSVLQRARSQQDAALEAAVLGSLGNAYRMIGEPQEALVALTASLQLAERLGNTPYQIAALNSLGNTYLSLAQIDYRKAGVVEQRDEEAAQELRKSASHNDAQALKHLEQGRSLARQQGDWQAELRSLVSAIPAYYRSNRVAQAQAAMQEAVALLPHLANSRGKAYGAIDLALLLQSHTGVPSKTRCLPVTPSPQAEDLLRQAVAIAQSLDDFRALSFAWGGLGHFYECQSNYKQAFNFTQQARWAADQALNSKDSLYLWEWQTGRILKAQQQVEAAIAAYERAVTTLEGIRNDILTAQRDVQFDFRDTVEPIYRQLVALRLSRAEPIATTNKQTAKEKVSPEFGPILNRIDSLKLAELQDYFGNNCVVVATEPGSADRPPSEATAILNTFILDNQTAVILSLPNGERRFAWIKVPQSELVAQVDNFRRGVQSFRERVYDTAPARQLYDWLIRPFEADLKQLGVTTLVFVQDGVFRSVPMAALHDGQQFLIEKYAVATTPSLSLTDDRPLERQNLRVLALGLTEAATVEGIGFPALKNVDKEIAGILSLIPASKELRNQDFTLDRLEQELRQTAYPVLHIATHGRFGIDPSDTFIVTGNQQALKFNQLEALIRKVAKRTEPLDLLALTACETAAGDDRATLGLAGIAIQAGAKSALATLWSVNDASTTKLATDFYTQLRTVGLSRARALQLAQKALLKDSQYEHPYFWSPFILIGNWQ